MMEKHRLLTLKRHVTALLADGYTTVSAMNLSDKPRVIPKGTLYGHFALIPEEEETAYTPERAFGPERSVGALGVGALKGGTADAETGTAAEIVGRLEEAPDRLAQIQQLDDSFGVSTNPRIVKPEDKRAALNLLAEFYPLFAYDGSFGTTDLVEHAIITKDVPPIKCRYRPINPKLEESLKKQIDVWLAQGVIEESNSPWCFALVSVKKKNGKIRWCVDYRRLNDITIKDAFPLPLIDDNLARLAHSKWFSIVDGSGAFHVVPVRPKDREKTAFGTPIGVYQFRRLPFGLANGPATYSRLVQKVLQGVPTEVALPYLDDTIIHSDTFERHLDSMRKVFTAYRKAGLRLQPEKCQLFQPQVPYLGHLISADGIAPLPDYVKEVQEWPPPTNRTAIRSFLGKVSYYRRFIPKFSETAAPLNDLTSADAADSDTAPLVLSPEALRSFQLLRTALLSAPILAYPDFDGDPFILDTDWSQKAASIGACLSQTQQGKERVICYGGKKLTQAQRNYGPTKGELFACLYFMKKWRYYLQYRPFRLRTDHRPLVAIRTMDAPTGMIARWLAALANFNFVVEHRPGKRHGNADGLSRADHLLEMEMDGDDDEAIASLVGCLCSLFATDLRHDYELPTLAADWRRQQRSDPELRQVCDFVEKAEWPDKGRSLGQAGQHYFSHREQLFLDKDGVLRFRLRPEDEAKICVPGHLQREVVQALHRELGHCGRNTLARALHAKAHMPHVKKTVEEVTRACEPCQRLAPGPSATKDIFSPVVDGYPFQRLSVDFVGPMPDSKRGNKYLLTVKDCFSRWVEAFPMKEATAAATIYVLINQVFSRFGYPESIHSDQGRQFTSRLMKDVCEALEIRLTTTPAYNPKSNPVERFHSDLKRGMRRVSRDAQSDWEEALPHVLMAHRMKPCRMTGLSPFEVLFGRDPPIPLPCLLPAPPPREPKPIHEVAQAVRERVLAAENYARARSCRLRSGDSVATTATAISGWRRATKCGCSPLLRERESVGSSALSGPDRGPSSKPSATPCTTSSPAGPGSCRTRSRSPATG